MTLPTSHVSAFLQRIQESLRGGREQKILELSLEDFRRNVRVSWDTTQTRKPPSPLCTHVQNAWGAGSTSLRSTWPHRELGSGAAGWVEHKTGPASPCKAVACNSGARTVGKSPLWEEGDHCCSSLTVKSKKCLTLLKLLRTSGRFYCCGLYLLLFLPLTFQNRKV